MDRDNRDPRQGTTDNPDKATTDAEQVTTDHLQGKKTGTTDTDTDRNMELTRTRTLTGDMDTKSVQVYKTICGGVAISLFWREQWTLVGPWAKEHFNVCEQFLVELGFFS
jgi:hypothetical protein